MRSSVCSHAESPALHSSVCVFFLFLQKSTLSFLLNPYTVQCARAPSVGYQIGQVI